MPMPKYLRNLDGTAGKPRLSEGTMLSEGPVNDCIIRAVSTSKWSTPRGAVPPRVTDVSLSFSFLLPNM